MRRFCFLIASERKRRARRRIVPNEREIEIGFQRSDNDETSSTPSG
jgi:hypothetical protein